jgi:hypothetical protein
MPFTGNKTGVANWFKQNATSQPDMEAQQAAQQAASAAQAKRAALQQLSGNAPVTPLPIPQVQNNAATMSPQDQDSRMNAMIATPLSGGTPMTFDAMGAANQAQMAQNALAAPAGPDIATMNQDQSSPHPSIRQFPLIQARVKSGQPVTSQDIRNSIKANEAMTPEQEAKLNQQLAGEDEDQPAHNINNKSGRSEGNYSSETNGP